MWISGGHTNPGEHAVRVAKDSAGFEHVYRQNGKSLTRIDYTAREDTVLDHILEAELTLRSAVKDADAWTTICECDDHDQLATWYQHTSERDGTVIVESIAPKSEYPTATLARDTGVRSGWNLVADEGAFEEALDDLLHAAYEQDISPSGTWTVRTDSNLAFSAWEMDIDRVTTQDDGLGVHD